MQGGGSSSGPLLTIVWCTVTVIPLNLEGRRTLALAPWLQDSTDKVLGDSIKCRFVAFMRPPLFRAAAGDALHHSKIFSPVIASFA